MSIRWLVQTSTQIEIEIYLWENKVIHIVVSLGCKCMASCLVCMCSFVQVKPTQMGTCLYDYKLNRK